MPVIIESRKNGETEYSFYCPACKIHHGVTKKWKFNGDYDKPTFSPSILVQWEYGIPLEKHWCHSFITDGRIRYLEDCTHDMKGQTLELKECEEEQE